MYYLIYRWLIVLFYVITEAVSISITHSWHEAALNLIYLTTWGILLGLVTAVFGAVLVSKWNCNPTFLCKPIVSDVID